MSLASGKVVASSLTGEEVSKHGTNSLDPDTGHDSAPDHAEVEGFRAANELGEP